MITVKIIAPFTRCLELTVMLDPNIRAVVKLVNNVSFPGRQNFS